MEGLSSVACRLSSNGVSRREAQQAMVSELTGNDLRIRPIDQRGCVTPLCLMLQARFLQDVARNGKEDNDIFSPPTYLSIYHVTLLTHTESTPPFAPGISCIPNLYIGSMRPGGGGL